MFLRNVWLFPLYTGYNPKDGLRHSYGHEKLTSRLRDL
jgi:hypothetical protein